MRRVLQFLFLLVLCFEMSALASITNEGADAVRLKFLHNNRKKSTAVIYPGQTLTLKSDVKEVSLEPLGSVWGDENIDILVIEPDGVENNLKDYKSKLIIGEEFQENLDAKTPTVENISNTNVVAVFIKANGTKRSKRLYPKDKVDVPDGTVAVVATPDGRTWGDEKIELEVTYSDETTESINSFGGMLRLTSDDDVEVDISGIFER